MLPEVVAALMLQPLLHEERLVLQPLHPHLFPAIADQVGIGRARLVGQHGGCPGKLGRQMAAVLVMDIVIVAIDGRGNRNHRLQRRRIEGGHLQAIEPAPGNPHHPDRAVRPGLRGDPGNQLAAVRQLQLRIFPIDNAIGFTGTTDVDAHPGNAGGGKDRIGGFIPRARPVALAVGEKFENSRHRICFGIVRQPDTGGKPGAIGQRDPVVFDCCEGAVGHVWIPCAPCATPTRRRCLTRRQYTD